MHDIISELKLIADNNLPHAEVRIFQIQETATQDLAKQEHPILHAGRLSFYQATLASSRRFEFLSLVKLRLA